MLNSYKTDYTTEKPRKLPGESGLAKPGKNHSAKILPIRRVAKEGGDSVSKSVRRSKQPPAFRDAVCGLCLRTISISLGVSLVSLKAKSRCDADTALARQIAMYLCHTTFSLLMTEVGLFFKRDRTTVAHACALVEDKRDDFDFDLLICQLEALLNDALHAMKTYDPDSAPLAEGECSL